ncbi:roadblock/LC7 domain-containing protein, partial [Streptomyces rubiginosohelvolus]|uniref:roadblock/LC7 domain-containing protein n=1 Tax=Streptomyces rubiginosohelvolus TaxID=67362 RepID=UPI003411C496
GAALVVIVCFWLLVLFGAAGHDSFDADLDTGRSGMQALAQGASIEFGDGSGGVRHSMTEFHGGLLFIVEAGEGAHLAVVATEEADPSIVGNQMTQMVDQIGEHLRAAPRGTVPGSASPGRTSPGSPS